MKKLLQSLFILMLLTGSVWAQNRTITGTVTGKDDGLPIPGVSVKIQGSTGGTSTGADGKYALSVSPGNNVLEFSSLGYAPETRVIGSSNVINVSLSTDAKQLGEVVVTALVLSGKPNQLDILLLL